MITDSEHLVAELKDVEASVWQALVDGDMQADAEALHHSFLGVYPDGFATKSDHIQQLENGPTISHYALSEFRVLPLNEVQAVLSYKASFQRNRSKQAEVMYVSSIWQRNNGGWISVFSQDTPANP